MSWIKWTVLLLLIPPSISGQEVDGSTPGPEIETASEWELIENGDFEGALLAVEHSTDASAHVIRAAAYNQLEEFDLATSEAWQALESSSIDERLLPEAYNQLGLSLLLPVTYEVHTLTDVEGALAALMDAEWSFRTALEQTEGAADGLLLNLACTLVAQRMIDHGWNRMAELEDLLLSVSGTMPERKEWAEAALANDPTLPDELSTFTHTDETQRLFRIGSAAPCRPGGVEPLQVGGDVLKPEKVSAPQPQYSESARVARIQGVVILQAVIGKAGRVACVKILQSLEPSLDEQARKAVLGWKFKPARLKGEPVAVYYNLTMNFRLQ